MSDTSNLNNYTLDRLNQGTPDTRVKRTFADVVSPSDACGGDPPATRMKEAHVTTGSANGPASIPCSPDLMKVICDSMQVILHPLTQQLDIQINSINNLSSELTKQKKELTELKAENNRLRNRLDKADDHIRHMFDKID